MPVTVCSRLFHDQALYLMTNWTDIYDRWHLPMQRIATSYLQDAFFAQDIVHDIFLRLLEKQLSPQFMEHAEAYLKAAVYHKCMSYFRKQQHRLSIDEWYVNNDIARNYTEEQLHYRELKQHYLKALKALPEKQKEVFVLRQLDGYKRAEIANLLGKSAKTIKKQYQQSNQTMRESLKVLRA